MSASSGANRPPNGFQRFAEALVFGRRPIVLALFAIVTIVLAFFAAQLKVDAGF